MEKTVTYENTQKVMMQLTLDLCSLYKELLIRDNKKSSGYLISSIRPMAIRLDNSKMVAEISLAEYWKYVENGRKPGKWPPINKILKWVEQKPVLPKPGKNGKLPTEKQLAFLISRKIGEKGIKPGNQLEEAIDKIWQTYEPLIKEAINEDLSQWLGIIWKEI